MRTVHPGKPDSLTRLTQMASQCLDPVLLVGPDLTVIYCSEDAARILGVDSEEVTTNPLNALPLRDAYGNPHWLCSGGTGVHGTSIMPHHAQVSAGAEDNREVVCTGLTFKDGHRLLVLHENPGRRFDGADPISSSPAAAELTRRLTRRELDVLRNVAAAKSVKTIAGDLFISEVTVRNHIRNILRKLGVHSKLEAVILAFRGRLL